MSRSRNVLVRCAQGGEALSDADTEAEIMAESAPALDQRPNPVAHGQRHLHRALGGSSSGIGSLKNTISPSR